MQDPETLTEEQAARMLADMNDVIRVGEEARRLRSEMIKLFAGYGWTQDKIAQLTGMSQPAVSKQVTKGRSCAPQSGLALDQHDTPWLEGRLWALADAISEHRDDTARCTRYVNAIARGRKRFTPENVDELRRLVEEDLRTEVPGSYRDTYDAISRGLDVPSKTAVATESATVRRALAYQIQRDRLRDHT